ncbi:hypothetical protein MRBLMN1_003175 [Chitinophaga ginsengisegetis]|uniref:hypothetical protein n=1 Tax=Chitinophaga ginsengisegetis TaxID=393003 RepID=UPI003425AC63
MIISFDLDDTLIPGIKTFPTEPQTLWHKLFSREKLRSGTIRLMKALQGKGHSVYIYTTSYRSPLYIRRLFFSYGIRLNKIINKRIHDETLRERAGIISKYPPAFSIDIHIDDSPGVAMEGGRYHFKTIIIEENNTGWTDFILAHLSRQ